MKSYRQPILVAGLLLTACGGGGSTITDSVASADSEQWQWQLPAFFPAPQVPSDNPMSAAKVELGRHLFYDTRLSGNGLQSCGSCHQQQKAFTDGLAVAIGSTGEIHPRNSQSVANVVYLPTITWANPALTSLEKQMEVPMFGDNPIEMGINDRNKAEVLARIAGDGDYPRMFAAAFPELAAPIDYPQIIKAIASFQRSLLSGDSRYDRWLSGEGTLSEAETRGKDLFFGEKAECFHCHGSFNFNDQVKHAASRIIETPFHNTGLFNIDGAGGFPFPNRGVFELTGEPTDMGRFRAPSLRNIEVTAPYMHDGSMASLEEVVDFYAAGGRVIDDGPNAGDGRMNPFRSDLVGLIDLSDSEKADLVAFMKTLTDETLLSDPRHADPFATR